MLSPHVMPFLLILTYSEDDSPQSLAECFLFEPAKVVLLPLQPEVESEMVLFVH